MRNPHLGFDIYIWCGRWSCIYGTLDLCSGVPMGRRQKIDSVKWATLVRMVTTNVNIEAYRTKYKYLKRPVEETAVNHVLKEVFRLITYEVLTNNKAFKIAAFGTFIKQTRRNMLSRFGQDRTAKPYRKTVVNVRLKVPTTQYFDEAGNKAYNHYDRFSALPKPYVNKTKPPIGPDLSVTGRLAALGNNIFHQEVTDAYRESRCIACDKPLVKPKTGRPPVMCKDPECKKYYHTLYAQLVRFDRRGRSIPLKQYEFSDYKSLRNAIVTCIENIPKDAPTHLAQLNDLIFAAVTVESTLTEAQLRELLSLTDEWSWQVFEHRILTMRLRRRLLREASAYNRGVEPKGEKVEEPS